MAEMERRLQLIANTFTEVNRTYFDGVIPAPKILINPRTWQTAGRVFIARWTMEISAQYFDHYGWEEELLCTVKHEAIHLYLAHMKRPFGHTKAFTAICARIGATRHCKAMPRRRPRYRYLVQCPQCRGRWYCGSWNPRVACKACCAVYNEGHFSPQFVLELVERVVVE
jgi:hypothetical protein